MADLTLKIKGDSQEAQKAVADLRGAIVSDVQRIQQSTNQFANTSKTDFDTVFRQLTQFRIGLSQLGRGDLGGIPNLIKGFQLVGGEIENVQPKVATAQQLFKALDATLEGVGIGVGKSKDVFQTFAQSLSLAATQSSAEAKKLKADFAKFGIDAETDFLKAEQAFKKFSLALSEVKGKGGLKSALNILGENNNEIGGATLRAIGEAGQKLTKLEAAETAAAASAETLGAGLSLATIGIGALVAVGVAATATLLAFANSASAYASKIQDAHEQTTFTVQSLQLLQAVGIANGVTFEQITNSISQFQDRLAQATEGNKKLATEFKNLGLDIQKSADNPEKAFFQLLTTLANVENAVERTALAKDLLGKSGVRLLRVLDDLTTGGKDFRTELESIGVILKGEDIAALDQFGDEWDRLKLTAQGAINLIAKEFIPTLIVGIQDGDAELKDLRDIWPKIGIAANEFFRDVIVGAKELKFEVSQLTEGLKNIFVPKLRQESFTEVLERMKLGASQIGQAIKGNQSEIETAFDKEVQALKDKLKKQEEEEASGLLAQHTAKQKAEQDKAADNAIKAIERENREIERTYADTIEKLKRNFSIRLETEQSFTEKLIFETEARRTRLTQALNEEADIVRNSKLAADKKDDRLDRISQQLIEVNRTADKEIETARFESFQRIQQAQIELERERLNTQRAADQAHLDVIRAGIEEEVLTREEGAARISAVVLAEIDRRIEAQKDEVRRVFVNEEQRRIEEEKLKALEIERTAAVVQGARERRAAQQADVASLRAFNQESQRIANSIAQLGTDFRATFANRQLDVIKETQAAQERAVLDEFALKKELFDEETARLESRKAQDEAEQQGILRRKQEIAQREIELEAEKEAKLQLIRRQAQVAVEQATPNSNRNVLGAETADALNALDVGNAVIGKQTTLFQQVNVAMSSYAQNLRRQLPTAAQTVILSLRAMATAAAASIAAFVAGEATVRQAAAGIVKAALEPYKQKAEAKAAIEYAEAASSFAAGDIAGGLKHTGAGLLWTGVGGLLGGIGNLVAGSGSSGAGAAITPSLVGTRQDQNTISTEERFRLCESGPGRPVTTIVLVTDRQMLVKDVEHGLTSSYQNDGAAKKIIDNATGGRPF